jgi:hypothetical protein
VLQRKADVVIPWRPDGPDCSAALHYVLAYLAGQGLRTILIESPSGPWVKALAVADAIGWSTAPIVVMHDADVICEGLTGAIEAVAEGAAWAIPHGQVRRLDQPSTTKVLAGGPLAGRLCEPAYRGHAGGGIVVLRRKVYDACPLDPRFVGWGREDDAWALALHTLHGEAWRSVADLWHLWHPEQPRSNRKYGNDANNALYRRYHEASGRGREAMKALVTEARDSYPSSVRAVRTFGSDGAL